MNLVITLRDGALGFVPNDAAGLAIIGQASGGPTLSLQTITDPKRAYDTFLNGTLPDRIAAHYGMSGPSPCYAMRPVASNAGTLPSYRETLSGTRLATGINGFPTVVSPSQARNVEIDFAALWDGGNVTIVGTGEDDAALTEIIVAVAGSTVKGLRVFKTIATITKAAVGVAAVTAQAFSGNKSTEGASTTDSNLTLSGTPLDDYEMVYQITRLGNVASGDAAFKASFDGGDTFTNEKAIPAGGVYSGFAATRGVTLTFVGALLKVGDEFRQVSNAPSMTTGDLGDALAALAADPAVWEGLHICGSLTGAQAAAVETWHATCRAAGRWAWTINEARDYNAAEKAAAGTTGNATWQTSVKADYSSVLSTFGQLSTVAGHIETQIPNRGIYRRSGAWAAASQIVRVPISVHPGSPAEAGPLRGVFKQGDGPGLYQDERVNPGMGGSTGRFMTLQTLLGNPGRFYIGDDQGHRDAGTMADGSSDYSMIPYVRLVLKCCRLMQVVGVRFLLRRLACKTNGTLLESVAKGLDDEVTSYLSTYLTGAGDCVSARAVASRSQNVLSTRILPFQVFILPFAYSSEVDISIGFEKVLV